MNANATININDIPEDIKERDIGADWTLVTTHNICTDSSVYAWWTIYRSPDGNLHRIKCWDGTNSSFHPRVQCETMAQPDITVEGEVLERNGWMLASTSEELSRYYRDSRREIYY